MQMHTLHKKIFSLQKVFACGICNLKKRELGKLNVSDMDGKSIIVCKLRKDKKAADLTITRAICN